MQIKIFFSKEAFFYPTKGWSEHIPWPNDRLCSDSHLLYANYWIIYLCPIFVSRIPGSHISLHLVHLALHFVWIALHFVWIALPFVFLWANIMSNRLEDVADTGFAVGGSEDIIDTFQDIWILITISPGSWIS